MKVKNPANAAGAVGGARGLGATNSMTKMTKYPQIGLGDAVQRLDEVLYPAYKHFRERQTRANALQVAEAAWALHERLWHDNGRKPELSQFRADLFKACPELKLMRDYAEAGKHVGLDRSDARHFDITGSENPGGIGEISDVCGQRPFSAECTLTMDYGDGETYNVPEVLKRVVEFWSTKLR
jgi:hypothetical protein